MSIVTIITNVTNLTLTTLTLINFWYFGNFRRSRIGEQSGPKIVSTAIDINNFHHIRCCCCCKVGCHLSVSEKFNL